MGGSYDVFLVNLRTQHVTLLAYANPLEVRQMFQATLYAAAVAFVDDSLT